MDKQAGPTGLALVINAVLRTVERKGRGSSQQRLAHFLKPAAIGVARIGNGRTHGSTYKGKEFSIMENDIGKE
ncbi:hypothetical protein PIB30_028939 [Stylosanthes scabra]|uniref:Uncharacterized protein n=1 Tax=Stylosanthes scabra TaxID=79078 RepID=A0ABU6SBB5_9FABA|nr:hypothetical protein [Stylosanthes scabra]